MSLQEEQAVAYISKLSRHSRMNNENGIVYCLYNIKRKQIFYQDIIDDSLPIIVELLHSQSPKVLSLSLSVLANACVSASARYILRTTNIEDYIVSILKDLKLSSKVHCRACRLVSNLSECNWHAQSLYRAGVIGLLVALLELKTIKPTYITAIKAIRNIWNNYEGSREKILNIEVIRLISQIFVQAKEKSDVDTKYCELVDVCLKAMCVFLISSNIRCGEQIEADKDKKGYKCIIRCCNDGKKLAINCLYNLCRIGTDCRLALSTCGAIEKLIVLVRSSNLMTHKKLSKEILTSLCLFCQESVHRAKISEGGGLELIVMQLKKPEFKRYHPMLLEALVYFSYCKTSIAILTKHGMLEILAEKLTEFSELIEKKSDSSFNSNNFKRKLSNDYSPYRKYQCTGEKRYFKYSSHYFDGDSSPGSVASVSSSPPNTPPLLSYDSIIGTDSIMDEDYSPVYSDSEWTDNNREQNVAEAQDEADSLKSLSLIIDTDNSRDSENAKSTVCDHTALKLLWTLSVYPKPIDKLADPTTIKALLSYINCTKSEIAITILTRIVRNEVYFMPLLKQGFVFDVHDLYKGEIYVELLWKVAETGGAIGQLSSVLLRGEEKLKLIAAVSIPFILRSRVSLKSLLHNYGGWQLIFRLLTEPSHELHKWAVWSICRLARTLQIYPETIDKYSRITTDDISPLHDYSQLNKSNHLLPTVTFILDDGTTMDACRHTLCRRSDAFSAMLEGNFCESGKQQVRLRDASRDGLNTLILAATGATYSHCSIESLLDAVLLADKFLMPDLLDELTYSSITKLCYTNFTRAWCWARSNACHELKSYCVKSFLTTTMTRNETLQTFCDFSAIEAFDEFLHDVGDIITSVLRQPLDFKQVQLSTISAII